MLQYPSQGPTAGKVSEGARTAGNQESMVPGTWEETTGQIRARPDIEALQGPTSHLSPTIYGLKLSGAGISFETEVLYPACIALGHIHKVHGLSLGKQSLREGSALGSSPTFERQST